MNKKYWDKKILKNLLLGTIGGARPTAYIPGPHKDSEFSNRINLISRLVRPETWTDTKHKLSPGYIPGDVGKKELSTFVVCIPKKIIDAVPDINALERLSMTFRTGVAGGTAPMEAAYVLRADPRMLVGDLSYVSGWLTKYAEEIKKFEGSITPCEAGDMKQVADRLSRLGQAFDLYFQLNMGKEFVDLPLKEDLLELGFDKNYQLLYVGYAKGGFKQPAPPPSKRAFFKIDGAKFLWKGFDYLAQTDLARDKTLVSFLIHMYKIINIIETEKAEDTKKWPWTKFLRTFVPTRCWVRDQTKRH